MCGVIGFVSKEKEKRPCEILVGGLKRLEYRGYDSWGVVFGNDPVVFKKAGRVSESRKLTNKPSYGGLGHTRWATHGGVTDENAHPHLDCKGEVAVVHNGIIENWEKLKSELQNKGHKFKSETDTEVVPHLVEEELKEEEDFVKAACRVFGRLEGLNAVAFYFPQHQAIVAFRKGSPLVVGVGEGRYFVASDVPAFLPYTKEAVFLSDGKGVVLRGSGVEVFDASSGEEVAYSSEEITWSQEEAQKGKYPHFLIKEINEQLEVLSRLAKYPDEEIKEVTSLIEESFGTYFSACGTAAHAGLAATYLFSDLASRHVNFSVGSEFYFQESFLTPKSLLIAASQSGETMDTLEAVRAAKRKGAKVCALVNVPGSTLTRLADKALMLECGPEKAVLATKSYTAKLGLFLLMASQMGGSLEEGRDLVLQAAKGVRDVLQKRNVEKIKSLAKRLRDVEHIYSIGRGVNYPTALEAALKIKEVSYIHAEGFAGGELKHGVIALIEEGMPCLVFVAEDQSKESVLSNAKEIKSRGAFVVGVSPEDNEVFDEWVKVSDVSYASPIVNTVPAQLLAYFLAVEKGLDPDKPRNLAKSVTVK